MTKPKGEAVAVIDVKIEVPIAQLGDFLTKWDDVVQDIIENAEIVSARATIPQGATIELTTY